MKVLVLSDSHGYLTLMKRAVEKIWPDVILHLGDCVEDGEEIKNKYFWIPYFGVAGNCDAYSWSPALREELTQKFEGVTLLLTHGHRYHVKSGTDALIKAAEEKNVDAVLYGHTHRADCRQTPDGLWVLNPGSCNYYGGSVACMEIENEKIVSCQILGWNDLEVIK